MWTNSTPGFVIFKHNLPSDVEEKAVSEIQECGHNVVSVCCLGMDFGTCEAQWMSTYVPSPSYMYPPQDSWYK